MSSAKPPPTNPQGPRGPRRRVPTIDLKATEVAGEQIAATASSPPSASETMESPAAQNSAAEPPATFPETPSSAPAEPPISDPSIDKRTETGDFGAQMPAAEAGPLSDRVATRRWLPLGAGAGAACAALALLAFWLFGSFSDRDPRVGAFEIRLARIEQQISELAGRPAPAGVDSNAVAELAARLTRIESRPPPAVPAVDAALVNRISALEGELKALAERQGVVARRGDEIAAVADDARKRVDATATAVAELQKARPGLPVVERREVEILANRVAALEQAAQALETKLVQSAAGENAARLLRLAVTAAAMQSAIERGDPFVAELGLAKSLATDPKTLSPLDPFAATGVPSVRALTRELAGLTPALRQTNGATGRDGNFLDRLAANAERVVRIRPIGDAPGDDPSATVARIELRAEQSDLAGALAELDKLPPAARAPAKDWIAKAEARNGAVTLGRRFASDALAALGQSSSERMHPK